MLLRRREYVLKRKQTSRHIMKKKSALGKNKKLPRLNASVSKRKLPRLNASASKRKPPTLLKPKDSLLNMKERQQKPKQKYLVLHKKLSRSAWPR